MTLKRDGDKLRLICRCRFPTAAYGRKQFQRMVDDAIDAGWRIEKRGDAYTHTCPSCVASEAAAADRRLF